ncbi:hypothetical protein B0T26DRAFT_177210 [Lasiosphaeria miniovina]|uniref:Uncharacterized protein n=1 Tax=Lasiosphaeria miniovina TaxID=1954250 RepID=A0AA40B6D6_9PEZI|nr:uncharacterized protein B0T26DRAFT_177210 [Lasiosphaeria miniovina]KAK0728564.1 hypothetical protein B0T26DRAFT_177210 [Lasiosphaeria miniovina]
MLRTAFRTRRATLLGQLAWLPERDATCVRIRCKYPAKNNGRGGPTRRRRRRSEEPTNTNKKIGWAGHQESPTRQPSRPSQAKPRHGMACGTGSGQVRSIGSLSVSCISLSLTHLGSYIQLPIRNRVASSLIPAARQFTSVITCSGFCKFFQKGPCLSLFQQIGKVLCSSAYLPTSRHAYAYITYMFTYLATRHYSVLNWPVPHSPGAKMQNVSIRPSI